MKAKEKLTHIKKRTKKGLKKAEKKFTKLNNECTERPLTRKQTAKWSRLETAIEIFTDLIKFIDK